MIHFFIDYGEYFPFKEAGTRLSIDTPGGTTAKE
jgi:hypothetical protein